MTLSPWIIYLWGIADNVSFAAGCMVLFSGIMAILISGAYLSLKSEGDEEFASKMPIKTTWALFAACVPLFCFVPSSKTIAVMVVAPAIINSDPIQKDLPELYKAAKDALMGTLTNK